MRKNKRKHTNKKTNNPYKNVKNLDNMFKNKINVKLLKINFDKINTIMKAFSINNNSDVIIDKDGKILLPIPPTYNYKFFKNIKIKNGHLELANKKLYFVKNSEMTVALLKSFLHIYQIAQYKQAIIKNVYLKNKNEQEISPRLKYSLDLRISKLIERTRQKLIKALGTHINKKFCIKWMFYNKKDKMWYFCYLFFIAKKSQK